MGTKRRAFEALWTPAAGGVGAAFGATLSTGAWVLTVFLAIAGAIAIGAQHRDQRVAVQRGAFSGLLFAGFVVLAYHVFGHQSDAPVWLLPPHDVLLFLLLFVPALPLHQAGAWLRTRLQPVPAETPVVEQPVVQEPERLPEPEPVLATPRT
jgi:hypothetical protein